MEKYHRLPTQCRGWSEVCYLMSCRDLKVLFLLQNLKKMVFLLRFSQPVSPNHVYTFAEAWGINGILVSPVVIL